MEFGAPLTWIPCLKLMSLELLLDQLCLNGGLVFQNKFHLIMMSIAIQSSLWLVFPALLATSDK